MHEMIENYFKYHAPKEDQLPRYTAIREAAAAFAKVIMENTPFGDDHLVAIRKVREAMMTANAAIACEEEQP